MDTFRSFLKNRRTRFWLIGALLVLMFLG